MSTLELTISDLSRGGAGVGRDPSGRVVFVPFTAPGDRVRVRIVKEDKRYAQGELVEILDRSPQRVEPRCKVFGRCGGCQWQHLSYELQWKTKVSGVVHTLKRVSIEVAPEVLEPLPAERFYEYRNRIQLRGQGEELGYFESGSHRRVPIDRCEIARPELNAALAEVRQEGAKKGREFKVELEVLPDGRVRRVWNSAHGAAGFRQIHDEQNSKLQIWVRDALSSGGVLLDLFGGAGNLSLPVASKMREVHCIDVRTPEAIPGAPPQLRFHRSPVLSWLLRAAKSASRLQATSAVLDPPREGLAGDHSAIASSLETLGVRELVAVGCDPDAWARDVSRFVKRGWEVKRVAVLDLFPQTSHVESLALLTLR